MVRTRETLSIAELDAVIRELKTVPWLSSEGYDDVRSAIVKLELQRQRILAQMGRFDS